MMKESRSNYINSLCNDNQTCSKRFWSLFKLKSKSCSVPEQISVGTISNTRSYANNPEDISNLFNNYFISIFTKDTDVENLDTTEPEVTSHTEPVFTDIIITEQTVCSLLQNLDTNKACGPDGIPAKLLKETARQISPSLTILFNKSLRTGTLPQDWKIANVVPVHKKGDNEQAENYRPISLLSLVSKVLERCVFLNIKQLVFSKINPCQHGFTPGRSCVTQLIEVLDKIGSQLDLGKQIDMIYPDMSKAFDKVSHKQLLNRLRDFGFGGNFLAWFQSYLNNRRQQTTVLGATSLPQQVTSGVPQGSILGPVLFLIYANNLYSTVTNSSIAAFADDTKIFKEIRHEMDPTSLQQDLSNFQTHSSNANLQLNPQKCKVLHITRKHAKTIHTYSLNNNNLETTKCERDLGVLTNEDLTWSKQVSNQIGAANKMLGLIRRCTHNIHNFSIRRKLYFALVRSHLGYASQIWSPQSTELIRKVEHVQRRASKYMLNLPFNCDMNYKQRLLACKILPLSYWHEYLDMLFFYKINHGIITLDKNAIATPQANRNTRSSDSNCYLYQTKKCKTSTYQKSYICRTTRNWNSLPKTLISKSLSLTNFKTQLYNYYLAALKDTYSSNDPRTWKGVCVKCNYSRNLVTVPSCCY